ncbi:hypothetical protein ACUNWD_09840 [Sunxiuqinia sp. A32]|uniref:hypothetical protein n=1 Tax=Sunxiuqinia sp. A32 TaxID=3461496 RepID=UPI0040454AD5
MVLVYPVVSMQNGLTHSSSREALLGVNPDAELVNLFFNENQVTENTPLTFLTHAEDDDLVPVENSIRSYEALKQIMFQWICIYSRKLNTGIRLNLLLPIGCNIFYK